LYVDEKGIVMAAIGALALVVIAIAMVFGADGAARLIGLLLIGAGYLLFFGVIAGFIWLWAALV